MMFKVTLLAALTAHAGAFDQLASDPWTIVPVSDRPGRALPVTAQARTERGTQIGQLLGTFVAECRNNVSSWWGSGTFGEGVSSAMTTQYKDSASGLEDSTYTVDYTEYVGDDCNPEKDTILAKYNIQGTVKYHGKTANPGSNPELDGAYQGEWISTGSTWLFPKSSDPMLSSWVNQLNDACKCGKEGWEIGVSKTIKPQQCHLKDDKDYPYLCYLANGTTGYANYKYIPSSIPGDPKTYIASAIKYDKLEGWAGAPISVPRYQLPAGGVTDPEDCNALNWYKCGNGIQEAAQYCEGCTDLECTGCLYRYQEKDNGIKNSTFWAACCPCDYYYSTKAPRRPWLQVDC